MKILKGSVYRVKHRRKGNFYLLVQRADENVTMGMVIEGKAGAILEENEVSIGEKITIRNSFCEFKKVAIREVQKS